MDLITAGTIIAFIGIIIIFTGFLLGAGRGESKIAVGGFIGFIPFGFANDKKMLGLVMGLSLVMLVLFLALRVMWK